MRSFDGIDRHSAAGGSPAEIVISAHQQDTPRGMGFAPCANGAYRSRVTPGGGMDEISQHNQPLRAGSVQGAGQTGEVRSQIALRNWDMVGSKGGALAEMRVGDQ
ncbi:MAG: hypothetical protein IPK19_20385 [Chloroflexi bacterium]|nr:hypothetical protein [Chloroflexota bacterium]